MFRLSRAILSTMLAWGVATLFLFIFGSLQEASSVFDQPIDRVAQGLAILGYFSAVVVFPTCLLLVVPALRFLPADSILWRPLPACIVGSGAAIVAIWLWAIAFRGRSLIPELHDRVHVGFGLAAISSGITFAFSYSR